METIEKKDYSWLTRVDASRSDADELNRIDRDVKEVFTYAPWDKTQEAQGGAVRDALMAAYKTVLANVPPCATRTVALRKLVEARMDCNSAITFRGGGV